MHKVNAAVVCIFYIILLRPVNAFNTDVSKFEVIKGPRKDTFFGYSVAATKEDGKLTIWSGSPKFSLHKNNASSAKIGAMYRCTEGEEIEKSMSCKRVKFKMENKDQQMNKTSQGGDDEGLLEETALSSCKFNGDTCGFKTDMVKNWQTMSSYYTRKTIIKKSNRAKCYAEFTPSCKLTSPPRYTVHGGLYIFNVDSLPYNAGHGKKNYSSILYYGVVQSRTGLTQCLRFCYNAFSRFDYSAEDMKNNVSRCFTGKKRTVKRPERNLRVWMVYENSTIQQDLFLFNGTRDIASRFWNFSEINIVNSQNSGYTLFFEISVAVIKTRSPRCGRASDIAVTDISVTNSPCDYEPENIDVADEEQSIGLSIKMKPSSSKAQAEQKPAIFTTCGSLYQQNCGYAKEASGICYELQQNLSKGNVEIRRSHNPGVKECIRGKIDIVLLVDQSGTVNQCNFQKVKRWLRNIVRSFDVGPTEQDIAVIVYSNPNDTKNVLELGFQKYQNSGKVKKRQMLEVLKKLPYAAGKTYTGVAFKHANDQLSGPNARPGAKKMIILLTDGETSHEDKVNLHQQVAISRKKGAKILAVGVAGYNTKELVNISGSERNFFPVSDFSELEKVRDKLRESVTHANLEGNDAHHNISDDTQHCQLGFSLHYGKNSLLMGSPGCFNRAGDVITYHDPGGAIKNRSKDLNTNVGIGNQNSTSTTISFITEPITKDKNTPSSLSGYLFPNIQQIEKALHSHVAESYLGYAVTSGFFRGLTEGEYIATSAPRFNSTGAVLIYKSNQYKPIEDSHVLLGRQLGEYFGYSLCAEDIDKDGFTDLFVGAPLHSDINPDEGRVYVFKGKLKLSAVPDLVFTGSNAAFSRFGMTITSVGDLTLDGCNDVAVSAPHEDTGVIYIFHGSNSTVSDKYIQRIAASDFKSKENISLFGQSITGGVDVDNNGYPDIIVGAPGSDSIVILRTRPVVHIETKFFISTPPIDRKQEECWKQNIPMGQASFVSCLECSACFSFFGVAVYPPVGVHYKIVADIHKKNSRLEFHETDERDYEGHLKLVKKDMYFCHNHTLYLKNNLQDMMTNVVLLLTYDFEESLPDHHVIVNGSVVNTSLPTSTDLSFILDAHSQKQHEASTAFKTYCEDISSCVADISLVQTHAVTKEGTKIKMYEVGSDRTMHLKLVLSNNGPEDAHAIKVTVQYTSTLTFNSIKKTSCFHVLMDSDEQINKLKTIVIVQSDPPLSMNKSCTGILVFLTSREDNVMFQIDASTVSIDNSLENNRKVITIPVLYQASYKLHGLPYSNLISYDLYNNTNYSARPFQHDFMIMNTGPTELRNFTYKLIWPVCIKVKEIHIFVFNVEHRTCNTSKLENHCRRHDNVYDAKNSSICEDTSRYKNSVCRNQMTLCRSISGRVEYLPPQDGIKIGISGFIEPSGIPVQTISSSLTSEITIFKNEGDSLLFSSEQIHSLKVITRVELKKNTDVIPEEKSFMDLPYWVYIVSVLAGILLLLILALVLRYAGFFRSKYAEKKSEAQEKLQNSSEMVPLNPPT